jgi:hypothetical protein
MIFTISHLREETIEDNKTIIMIITIVVAIMEAILIKIIIEDMIKKITELIMNINKTRIIIVDAMNA